MVSFSVKRKRGCTVSIIAPLMFSFLTLGLSSRCPKWPEAEESFHFMDMCYNLIQKIKLNWSEARDFCTEKGWQLAYKNVWNTAAISSNIKKTQGTCWWIGATDQVKEGDWRWLDGLPVVNVDWDYGVFDFVTKFTYDCAALCCKNFGCEVWHIDQLNCQNDWGIICQQDMFQPKAVASLTTPPTKSTYTFALKQVFRNKSFRIKSTPDMTIKSTQLVQCTRLCIATLSLCGLINFNFKSSECRLYNAGKVIES